MVREATQNSSHLKGRLGSIVYRFYVGAQMALTLDPEIALKLMDEFLQSRCFAFVWHA